RNMDTSLEEAALTAGSSTFSTFCRVTLPLMRPAMFSVLLINFIRGIEAFEVPALIGVPAKISVFTTKIFLAIHQFPSDFGLASAYAVTLLVISTTGVLIYRRITRREERYATVTGKGYRPRVIDLGVWKYLTLGVSFLIFFLAVILPVFVLLWSSFIPYYGVPSRELMEKMTWANYQYILNYPPSLTAGGTWFQTFRKVILPLLMPGFTAGWIYISIIALRELSTSILLYSYNSTVLSIMAFDLWEGGQYTYVCALGVLMVLLLVTM